MRVLAVIYAVPGVGWAVATLALVMAPASFALGRVFVLPYVAGITQREPGPTP